jgi:hypothetical protein
MFLVHPTLSEQTVERTCSVARDVISRALK